MKYYINKIYKKLRFLYYKNKDHKNETAFYKFFYTIHPGWNKPEPNEDESLRWSEIQKGILQLNMNTQNLSLLEIGCGRGWMTERLSKSFSSVIGIDPIVPVIEYARKLFPDRQFFIETPSGFIRKFPENKFDVVVTSEVIEHVHDKIEFLQNIFDLLRENGTLILTTPRSEHFDDFTAIYGTKNMQPVEEWVSEEQIKQLFEKQGFEIIHKSFFSPLPHKEKIMMIYQLWVCRKKKKIV